MSTFLHSSFQGSPLRFSRSRTNGGKSSFFLNGKTDIRASFNFLLPRESQIWCNEARFSCVRGISVSSRSRFRIYCTKEPSCKARDLISSFSPLWEQGMLLFRCSIFVAVISAVGVLVWYAQLKARTFVEVQILPSVCSVLSEYLRREVAIGKVQSVSPLGITLHSCSIGPHREEFSCGEVSTMKLRIRPFTSLRRGKIVVDAFLSRPTVLVAQKEDFSWLGIPSPSESGMLTRHSTEEGIDYRTKTKREARERSASAWAKERVKAAKEASEMGYIVHPHNPTILLNDDLKDDSGHSTEAGKTGLFYCMDEKMHRRDHDCMDSGIGYGSKHADLEKSFGVKISGQGLKFWSVAIPNPFKWKVKRDAYKTAFESSFTARQRNLVRSAAAASAYFRSLDIMGNSTDSCGKQGRDSSGGGPEDSGADEVAVKDEAASDTNVTTVTTDDQHRFQYTSKLLPNKGSQSTMKQPYEASGHSLDDSMFDKGNNKITRAGLENEHIVEGNHSCGQVYGLRVNNGYGYDNENSLLDGRNIGYLEKHHSLGYVSGVNSFQDPVLETLQSSFEDRCANYQGFTLADFGMCPQIHQKISFWPVNHKAWSYKFPINVNELLLDRFAHVIHTLKLCFSIKSEDVAAELAEEVNETHKEGIENFIPITLDSVYFTDGNLMLLGFGDREAREMMRVNGYVRLQNQYSRVHVQLSGDCCEWRTESASQSGGRLSIDAFVDTFEQKWHANLKILNLFAPLFEGILEIPVMWSKGRASGEVHICMSEGDTFPNLHGQLDVSGLSFHILDAPSQFSELTASLCFRGQRIFLHNTSGWFGDTPLEASGDFGINPEDGEFHLMCQVPCVEVNALIKTLKMRPLMFPGEVDDMAMDVNLSGNFSFDKILYRYLHHGVQLPLKIGELNGQTRLSGSLLRPKFDIKWAAPKAEDSFSDARGDIIISHEYITISSSSVGFDLYTKVQTSYPEDYWLQKQIEDFRRTMPLFIDGIDLDLRLRGFEFARMISSSPFDSQRPLHLKATGRIKFQGKIVKPNRNVDIDEKIIGLEKAMQDFQMTVNDKQCLFGDLSLSGININQLLLAPQLAGSVYIP